MGLAQAAKLAVQSWYRHLRGTYAVKYRLTYTAPFGTPAAQDSIIGMLVSNFDVIFDAYCYSVI